MSNRRLIIYICVTLFCGLFSALYEHFSLGIYSNFMIYLFAIPLLFGVVPEILLRIFKPLRVDSPWARLLANFAIATLSVGSALQGVLEIYGTADRGTVTYLIAGTIFLLLSIAIFGRALRKAR